MVERGVLEEGVVGNLIVYSLFVCKTLTWVFLGLCFFALTIYCLFVLENMF
jgi:hypothetical protein